MILKIRLEDENSDISSDFIVKERPRSLQAEDIQEFLEGNPSLQQVFQNNARIYVQLYEDKIYLYTKNVFWVVNGSYNKGLVILLPGKSERIKMGNTSFIFECQFPKTPPAAYKETTTDKIQRAIFSPLASFIINKLWKRQK